MIEALIAGQRDPKVLADMARGRMKAKHSELIAALDGRFDDHHAELARMLLGQIDALPQQIDTLTVRIEELIDQLPGVALRAFIASGLVLAPMWTILPVVAFVYGRLRLALATFLGYAAYECFTLGGFPMENASGLALRGLLATALALGSARSLSITNVETVNLNANVTAGGGASFGGAAVTVGASVTVDTSTGIGAISFSGTVDDTTAGSNTLTLKAGTVTTGTVTLGAAAGSLLCGWAIMNKMANLVG